MKLIKCSRCDKPMEKRKLEGHMKRCKGVLDAPTVHEDPNEESKDEAYDQQSAVADLPA